MVKVFIDSDKSRKEREGFNPIDEPFDLLVASRYSFFSPAILQKFLSASLQKNKSLMPFCNSVYATILFADISGFTRLSSHINVESLKKHINHFFTSLLGVVKEFNGDVIKFCGDAVMIMWPVSNSAPNGVKAATAYLAASCAVKLLSDCGTYTRQEKGYKVLLRLHCGIGSGLVHCMCLGEGDRWEFLISGDPLRQVGVAESEAGIGEVCMSEESYALVSDRFDGTEMPEGSRNLVLTKHLKKTRSSTNNETVNAVPEKLQVPLEVDLLNKLTSEQSRLSVGTINEDGNHSEQESSEGSKSFHLNKNGEPSSWFESETESKGDQTPRRGGSHHPYTIYESKQSCEEKDIAPPPDRSPLERSPLSIATSAPTPKRQSFFSPIFSQSPLSQSNDNFLDKELKKNIAIAKSYLSEFLCTGYIPPRTIVPYLQKFLMSPAKMAIENDTLNYVAELREVVTIFIEVLGLEDDFNMGFVRRPQRVITTVLECLDKYSGSLRQYVVDDKGCVIIAAFGLPGSSHEDNCVRAIEAATLIRDNFAEVKIDCRIGIAKGVVYCGLVGSDDRCEYAMMGSSVNLAARLMGKGESGNILVNQDVQAATEKLFKFHALQKIKAKGYAKPVAVFIPYERIHTHELAAHKTRVDSVDANVALSSAEDDAKLKNHVKKETKKPQFIGRETELATFKRSLEIFVAQDESRTNSLPSTGTQQAHVVEGQAGAGKTWFILEIIRMAKKIPGITRVFICATAGQTQKSSQYYIIGQLIEQIFGISIMNNTINSARNTSGQVEARRTTPKTGSKVSNDSVNPSIRQDILAWFERNDPGGRVISSKLKFRVPDPVTPPESVKTNPTRMSFLSRSHTISKFSRQYQKTSSADMINNLDLAVTSQKRVKALNSKVSGESDVPLDPLMSDDYIPPEEVVETKEFHYSELLPLLSDILAVRIEDTETTAHLSFTDRKTYCEALVMYIFELALERQKTVLIVENIHWCDSGSLTYLNHWLRKKNGCFFLCTTRVSGDSKNLPSFDNEPYRQRRRNSNSDALKLRHDTYAAHMLNELYQQCASTALHFFSSVEITKLLEATIDPYLLSQFPLVLNSDNIEKIQKHTDGSPILSHILAVELEDALRKGTFKSIDDLPSGTDALILNRFDKLSTKDQIILKVASVLGQTFTTNELSSVLYRCGNLNSSQGLSEALTMLVSSNLIQSAEVTDRQSLFDSQNNSESTEVIPDNSGTYSFVNKSVQDGIYYLMLEGQRKATHAVIGAILEEQLEVSGPNPSLFLAATNHYWRSDNLVKKFEFLVRAAENAKYKNDNYMVNNCYGELVFMKTDKNIGDLLASCSDQITRDQRKRDLWGILSNMKITFAFGSKRYTLTRQESLKNIYDTEGFGTDRKWIQKKELKSRFQSREVFSERIICVWIGEVARARFNLGDFRAAHNLFLLALYNAHLPLPIIDMESFFYSRMATCCHTSIDLVSYGVQSKFSHENTPLCEVSDIELSFVQSYFYLALILFIHGNLEGAAYLLETARGLLRYVSSRDRNEILNTEIRVVALQAVAAHYCGKFSKARNLFAFLDQKCQHSTDPSQTSTRLMAYAMIEIFRGEFKDSRIKLKRSMDILGILNEGLMQHMVGLNLGWSLFFSGRLTEAQDIIASVMSYAMSTDHTTLLVWTYQLNMLVRVFSGEFAMVEIIAQKVRSISRKDTHATGTSAVLGMALIMQRKFDQALLHVRYACGKLAASRHVFLHGSVLLYCSLFSALSILRMQQAISNQTSPMECLSHLIREGMDALWTSSMTHGILKLLYHALALQTRHCPKYLDILHPKAELDSVLEDELPFTYNEFIFGRAFFNLLLAHDERSYADTERHINEADKLFSKLSPPTSKRMFLSCKNLLSSNSVARSDLVESLHVQPQNSIDSRFGRSHFETSESAGDVFSHPGVPSPRKKHTGLDLAVVDSPQLSQSQSISEPPQTSREEVAVEQFVPFRVLVVDDAPTALKITSRMLTKIGCEVTVATNGLEAVELILELTRNSSPWFDAIVLDLQMPVMDGIEACQRIRAHERQILLTPNQIYKNKQRIIAVSVNADDATREETANSGFDYFMPKPFRVDEFEAIMDKSTSKDSNSIR